MKPEEEYLLTPQQAARQLGLSQSWLAKLRVYGTGPVFVKIGRLVRYRPKDLIEWAEARVRHSTSDEGNKRTDLTSLRGGFGHE